MPMQNLKKESFSAFENKSGGGERGVSLYFALLIMTILLAIGFGLSTIIVSQMKMIKGMGDSVVALHAADTGIERALYALYKENVSPGDTNYSDCLDLNQDGCDAQDPTYQVNGLAPGSNCPATYYCLKSNGTYKETKRAIEASY